MSTQCSMPYMLTSTSDVNGLKTKAVCPYPTLRAAQEAMETEYTAVMEQLGHPAAKIAPSLLLLLEAGDKHYNWEITPVNHKLAA